MDDSSAPTKKSKKEAQEKRQKESKNKNNGKNSKQIENVKPKRDADATTSNKKGKNQHTAFAQYERLKTINKTSNSKINCPNGKKATKRT